MPPSDEIASWVVQEPSSLQDLTLYNLLFIAWSSFHLPWFYFPLYTSLRTGLMVYIRKLVYVFGFMALFIMPIALFKYKTCLRYINLPNKISWDWGNRIDLLSLKLCYLRNCCKVSLPQRAAILDFCMHLANFFISNVEMLIYSCI